MSNSLASLTAQYTDSEGEEDKAEVEDMSLGTQSSRSSPVQFSNTDSPMLTKDGSLPKLAYYDLSEGEEKSESEDESVGGSVEMVASRSDTRSPEEDFKPKTEADLWLPPEPTGKCPDRLQMRVAEMYERKIRDGMDFNAKIQELKSFRNPSIYEKLLEYCHVDELGTNYPPDLYDPHMWGKESFYEELAKAQKEEMDKREKERKAKATKDVSSASLVKRVTSPAPDEKRKSKWDQVGPSIGLVSSATGTKPAIAAFGSLKKPKV